MGTCKLSPAKAFTKLGLRVIRYVQSTTILQDQNSSTATLHIGHALYEHPYAYGHLTVSPVRTWMSLRHRWSRLPMAACTVKVHNSRTSCWKTTTAFSSHCMINDWSKRADRSWKTIELIPSFAEFHRLSMCATSCASDKKSGSCWIFHTTQN